MPFLAHGKRWINALYKAGLAKNASDQKVDVGNKLFAATTAAAMTAAVENRLCSLSGRIRISAIGLLHCYQFMKL